jgi:hypothetical protein
MKGVLQAGTSRIWTFARAYLIPFGAVYGVTGRAELPCDIYVADNQDAITECVDMDDIALIDVLTPSGTYDSVGSAIQLEIAMENYSSNTYSNVVVNAVISDGITSIPITGTIANIAPGQQNYQFTTAYTVPNVPQYTIKVFINSVDNYPYNDTLTRKRQTGTPIKCDISGKIMRQDSTPVTLGTVQLYKKRTWGNMYLLLSSVSVANNGSYLFPQVADGQYLIKFMPDSSENALPTYYGNTISWLSATPVTVTNNSPIQNIDIILIPKPQPMGGSSLIGGYVGKEDDGTQGISQKSVSNPAKDVCVYLQKQQNSTWNTVAYTLTNANGYFEFRNVSAGKYKVILDVPGLEIDNPQIIDINEGDTIVGIEYEITPDGIINKSGGVGIKSLHVTHYALQIYPNPTTGQLRIMNYELGENTVIEIYDIYGKNVFTSPNPSKGGEQATNRAGIKLHTVSSPPSEGLGEVVIDISHLAKGMYFLKVDNRMYKVVKQ